MLRRLRATAPAALVPLAWGFAAATHTELLTAHTVFVGHVVMTTLLIAFAGLSWREMRTDPVLRVWLAVIVAGIPVTLAGAYGVATGKPLGFRLAVFGWMLLPALALVPIAHRVGGADGLDRRYTLAMGLAALGAFVFLIGGSSLVLTAITLVAVGQTSRSSWQCGTRSSLTDSASPNEGPASPVLQSVYSPETGVSKRV
ncbi:hypothetical protein SY89_00108 [Halolamina pelagica]|uniref:Uncharacterized protein n=1 Tax=Halolamina pelagica TaxID=699431 RepID=A0A0N8HZF9_9EURY|nr:hypothetical protein [Halolamina pelagica]KPN29395.1 hypothetical protein SY89_00108 [Halolamina pelagica]